LGQNSAENLGLRLSPKGGKGQSRISSTCTPKKVAGNETAFIQGERTAQNSAIRGDSGEGPASRQIPKAQRAIG
jgi:hypothetical protein